MLTLAMHVFVAKHERDRRALPGGLKIAVNLRSRITGDTAVGTLIDGLVAQDVMKKGVAIAVGSLVHGRIRRLERYTDPVPHFVVAVEFTEVAMENIRHRFYADLLQIEPAPGVEQTLSLATKTEPWDMGSGGLAFKRTTQTFSLSNPSGVATFFFRGTRMDLLPGFQTVWKTSQLAP